MKIYQLNYSKEDCSLKVKTCTKCKETKDVSLFYRYMRSKDGLMCWCKQCKSQKEKERRQRDPDHYKNYINNNRDFYNSHRRERARIYQQRPEERIKASARQKTRLAVLSGKLEKKPCESCGEIKVEAHHPDYSKPLEVIWLCLKHHRQIHEK